MNALVTADAGYYHLELTDLDLTTRDNDPDGGIDGWINWPDSVRHDILGPGRTVLQYKSGELTDADLRREFVKLGVQSALGTGQRYVLFVGRDYVTNTRDKHNLVLQQLCEEKKVDKNLCKIIYGDHIARWINAVPRVAIMPELGKGFPAFTTVDSWATLPNFRNPYHLDAARSEFINEINKFALNPRGDYTLRVEGPAGVGKTRVVLEALRTKYFAENTIYCPNAEDPNCQQLITLVTSNPDAHAIIVVDECEAERQEVLRSFVELTEGRIVLICVGVAEIVNQSRELLSNTLVLLPLDDSDIEIILIEFQPDVAREILDTAIRVSGGYVKLAIYVLTTLLQQQELTLPDLVKVRNVRQFLDRFVHPDTYNTLKALSLLAKVGWRDERDVEARALAKELELPFTTMQDAVARLKEQGVVIERGFSLYVSPDLLAISAAAAMWEARGPGLIEIIEKLPGPVPKRQLLRRLATMHEHDTVRTAVERLLLPDGLYKTIADLDHDFLSEVFRFFASTLPKPALEVLERLIGPAPKEDLLSFKGGRRDVIWAIESLMRWPDTSLRAARMLARLALAETESIANNATGTLKTYFHMYLSGSPIPLTERFTAIEEVLSIGTSEARELATVVTAAALQADETRMGDDFDQISRRRYPDEWRPKTWNDLWNSRRMAIKLLQRIAVGDDVAGKKARHELIRCTRTITREGLVDDAIALLSALFPLSDEERLEVLDRAQRLLTDEELQLSEQQRVSLTNITRLTFSELLFDQIKRWVGKRVGSDYDLSGRGYDEADSKASELAERAFKEGLSEDELKWLASRDAENVWPFGQKLGAIDESMSLFDSIVSVSSLDLNGVFLASYLAGVDEEKREDALDRLADINPSLAFVASWRNGPSVRAGFRVLRIMDSVDMRLRSALRYGNWLATLPDECSTHILEKLLAHKETGDVARPNIANFAEKNPGWANAHTELLWRALELPIEGTMDEWEWGRISRVAVQINAEHVAVFCVKFLTTDEGPHLSSHAVVQALAEATKLAMLKVWPIVGEALLNDDVGAFRLRLSLEHWYGELIDATILCDWARQNGQKGRLIAALLITPGTPFRERARALISEFPDDDDILQIFGGQFFHGVFAGPLSNHTKDVLQKIEVLLQDPDPRIAAWAGRLKRSTEEMLERQRLQEEDNEL